MKKTILSALMLLVAVTGIQAKSWKIGPASVNGMDFASINAAMNSSLVSAGDTLYLDQYYNENQVQTVTKRVVIIGTGYDISQTNEQVVARLTNNIELKANNVELKSIFLNYVSIYSEGCIIDRCFSYYIQVLSNTSGFNYVRSCYINGYIYGYSTSPRTTKMDIQNCVFVDGNDGIHTIENLTGSIINNNVIFKQYYNHNDFYALADIDNSQITNNMVYGMSTRYGYERSVKSNVSDSGSGNSIEHNILSCSALSYYPSNKAGYSATWSTLFANSGNYSDVYRLATESGDNPAIGYATDGGDVGCHGGMFGNPAGGRPQYIPYFSKVVVGSRTENGKLPVSVTVKIQDE